MPDKQRTRRPRWPPERVARLVSMAADHTLPEIAATFGTTVSAVRHVLQREGVRWKVVKKSRAIFSYEDALQRRLRRIAGEETAALAAERGAKPHCLWRAWARYGIADTHPLGKRRRRWTTADIRWIHQRRDMAAKPTPWAEIAAHFEVSEGAARSIYYNHREMIQ